MSWLRRLWNVFRSARVQRDIEREVAFHLAERADDERASGLSDDESRRRARLRFGNPTVQAERTREADIAGWLDDLLHDVRQAFRSIRRTPSFTVAVVLTLALGIGVNTAVFSVVDGVLLKPLLYPDADRLVRVAGRTQPQINVPRGELPFNAPSYWHFVRNNRTFERFGGAEVYAGTNGVDEWTLIAGERPVSVDVARMTASAFELLGVPPRLGRLPTAEEDLPGGPGLVLLSESLWRGVFASDPSIVGRTVELNGVSREIVGVMREGYDFPDPTVDVWIPLQLNPASRDGRPSIHGIARLAPGVTLAAATEDAESLFARLDEIGFRAWQGTFTGEVALRTLKNDLVGDSRRPLLILLTTMGFVLLIACSNVANLFQIRAEARSLDTAVRAALGSGRRRLVQLVLTEGVLLGLLGGVAGLLLAYAGIRTLVWVAPPGIPRLADIGLNRTVLSFTAAVSIVAGLLFALLPALYTKSSQMQRTLRVGGRGGASRERQHVRRVLVATQVALALALFVGSTLMVRSLAALGSVDPGFNPGGVLTFRVSPAHERYRDSDAVARFYDELLDRLRAIPGVATAGAVQFLPLTGGIGGLGGPFLGARIDDFPPAQGEPSPTFVFRRAAPGYFESMRIPLVEGRTFTAADHEARLGSLIISRAVKDRYWPNGSALGKRITIAGAPATVVGVVGDVHDTALDIPAEPVIYKPMLDAVGSDGFLNVNVRAMTVTVRTSLDPLTIAPEVRTVVGSMDPDLPIADLQPMFSLVDRSLSRMSFTVVILTLGAAVALLLGAVGIYGVIAYQVSQRTEEIGLRQALGADRSGILRLVLGEGLWVVAAGLVLGMAAAVGLGRTLSSLLFGIGPYDVATLVGSSVVFVLVAALASAVPAVRAARVPPAVALRGG
jgi:putative ABC transport system permease protein